MEIKTNQVQRHRETERRQREGQSTEIIHKYSQLDLTHAAPLALAEGNSKTAWVLFERNKFLKYGTQISHQTRRGIINQPPNTGTSYCSGSTGFIHSEPTGPMGSEVLSSPLPVFSSLRLLPHHTIMPRWIFTAQGNLWFVSKFPAFYSISIEGEQ